MLQIPAHLKFADAPRMPAAPPPALFRAPFVPLPPPPAALPAVPFIRPLHRRTPNHRYQCPAIQVADTRGCRDLCLQHCIYFLNFPTVGCWYQDKLAAVIQHIVVLQHGGGRTFTMEDLDELLRRSRR